MKVCISPIVIAVLAIAASEAHAQSIVSWGVGLAHDCFVSAKTGRDLRGGVDVCNEALKREKLNQKDLAATYDNRGVMLDALGQVAEAERDFNTSISLQPTLGDPYVNLGSVLIKRRDYQAALDHINKGLELGMSFPHIGYYDRAIAEQLMGRYKEAYYDYKKVLELEPNYTAASERLKDFVVTRVPAGNPS